MTPITRAEPIAAEEAAVPFDAAKVKACFPIFFDNALTRKLSYLDNAATSQKPLSVLQAMDNAVRSYCSPVHRGFYPIAEQSTQRYEQARQTLTDFISAKTSASIIFNASATDGINQIAKGFLLPRLSAGQNVWVTRMEHHANYLPWLFVCDKAGANLRIIELSDNGELDIDGAHGLFADNTAMIALSHTSNVLGTNNDVYALCKKAREHDIPILIDAAQAMVTHSLDVESLSCDFLVFSAHKMFGPTGIGLLYIAPHRLGDVQPLRLGGGMVDFTADTFAQTIWSEPPYCFEAGSPNLAGAIGFAAACEFVNAIGQHQAKQYISSLALQLYQALLDFDRVKLLTPLKHVSSGIISFYHDDIHAHDLAHIMGDAGVAVRAGHHCAQPLLAHFNVNSTVRASISVYNTPEDIVALITALRHAQTVFA
ncbi:aminotransferase class V-fold PLP-dependent enzyme [Glaciecola siphonariae]|uniref:cysteine desulfurase n=1 Tax=Glaciecola siphonariae TaxID=521012 RepID=A0ABV9M0R4_9ALTE